MRRFAFVLTMREKGYSESHIADLIARRRSDQKTGVFLSWEKYLPDASAPKKRGRKPKVSADTLLPYWWNKLDG